MKKYSTIIWDFNGTLVDDVYAAIGAVNDMLIKRNQNPITINEYSENVDIPIWKFYERVFVPGTITPEDAISEFAAGYDKYIKPRPLMEGAEEILSYLQKAGKNQLVVSASHIDKVTASLETLGIRSYFQTVLALTDYNCTDKSFLAQQYVSENNISAECVLVIGDCVADWQMSKALYCDCVLITKGHQSRREFALTDAIIIDSLIELKNFIK